MLCKLEAAGNLFGMEYSHLHSQIYEVQWNVASLLGWLTINFVCNFNRCYKWKPDFTGLFPLVVTFFFQRRFKDLYYEGNKHHHLIVEGRQPKYTLLDSCLSLIWDKQIDAAKIKLGWQSRYTALPTVLQKSWRIYIVPSQPAFPWINLEEVKRGVGNWGRSPEQNICRIVKKCIRKWIWLQLIKQLLLHSSKCSCVQWDLFPEKRG